MRIDPQDLKRHPELAALVAQKLGADVTPRRPERRHPYRRRPTSVREPGCATCTVRQAPTRADEESAMFGVAFAWTLAFVLVVCMSGWTQPVRDALKAAAAIVPVWSGWLAVAVLVPTWYGAKRVGGDLDRYRGLALLGRLLAALAVLVAGVTVAAGIMGW